jgi:hypothetical protein
VQLRDADFTVQDCVFVPTDHPGLELSGAAGLFIEDFDGRTPLLIDLGHEGSLGENHLSGILGWPGLEDGREPLEAPNGVVITLNGTSLDGETFPDGTFANHRLAFEPVEWP